MDRYLGLDIGTKTIGIALSDPLKIIAQPIATKTYLSHDINEAIIIIKQLIKEHKISKIIYGLPLNMDGTTSTTTNYVNDLINIAKKEIKLPFFAIDERLTSISATKFLVQGNFKKSQRKVLNDQMAASIILRTYLDKSE